MASAWLVKYRDGSSERVELRISDELAWERRSRTEPGGKLERVLFMLHRATGKKQPLDAWVEEVEDFDPVPADESDGQDPSDPPPATTQT